MEDIIVASTDGWPFKLCAVPIIYVLAHTTDYPNYFVARLYDSTTPTDYIALSNDLQALHQVVPPWMMRLPRVDADDPVIVECWI